VRVGGGGGLLDNFNEAKGMNLIHTTNLIPFNGDSTKPLNHLQHKFMATLVGSILVEAKLWCVKYAQEGSLTCIL
jgi:hypothetical protein